MKESRRLEIRKKVFAKTDVRNLAQTVFNEYEQALDNQVSISFQMNCNDGTSYESESISIFDDGGVIDLKKTNSIDITFHNHSQKQYINVFFSHGGGHRDYLTVQGFDSNWVNGIFTRLKEIIDSVKPQDNWLLNHKNLILHFSSLGIGAIIYFFVWLIFFRHIEPIKNPSETLKSIANALFPVKNVLPWLSYWGFGIGFAMQFRDWLLQLWPNIEFDFGPDHLRIEKMRRTRIYIFLTLVVVPLSLSTIFDFAKLIIFK